ncbi:uncharacterized protein LOC121738235 [Aricia agestis]|uniref:uncharacterized protein LOC121738235 n=1 Tax=Aricia agestis TaxID=91739 RepID=UPI001C203938|nr:uncharacterized protein LOC121738235 [Aricia agestis]
MSSRGGSRQGGVEDEGGGSHGGGNRSSDEEFLAFYGDERSGEDNILEEVRNEGGSCEKEKQVRGKRSCGPQRGSARAGISVEELLGTESIPSMSESEIVASKRLFSELSGSDTEEIGVGSDRTVKAQTAKRGKTRGSTSRLSAARQELRERTKEAKEADFIASLEKRSFRKEVTVLDNPTPPGPLDLDVEVMGPEDLLRAGESNLQEILAIANKSTNLKGGYANKIKRATSTLRVVLDALGARTEAEETRRLKADNNRLQRELANLREEVRAYKREFEESRTEAVKAKSSPMSSEQLGILERNIARLVGSLVDRRLAGLEERLPPLAPIRPPLAADKKRAAQAQEKREVSLAPVASQARDASPVMPSNVTRRVVREDFPALPVRPEVRSAPAPAKPKKSKAKGSKKSNSGEPMDAGPSSSSESAVAAASASKEAPTTTATASEQPAAGWTEVVRRKAPKKKAPEPVKPAVKKPKVVMPRSTAVVVKLKPEAVSSGVTYSSVLQKAELSINLDDLGIGPLRIRQAATGARVIEIPGSTSHDKADTLAARLSEVLAGEVDVSRPVKCADFKITGLSDAATAESVKSAVAREGGCSPAQIWVGEIQRGLVGTGFARMSCPVTAAKKLVSLGSIAVGWSKVTLHLVNACPKHCFRCLGLGHFAALCPPSMKDRSNLCYRCGQPGHNASGCQVTKLKCAVCSDAGRPAEHVMGGRSCNPPPVRGKLPNTPRGVASPEAQMSE